jgi:ABC-type cobalamin/Fe3+-siderophores transport system ATPase subunit
LDFKQAELYLNQSFLFGRPSLMVIGANGIGKTVMLNEVERLFSKRCREPGTIDFGGLMQAAKEMNQTKEDIIVIPDLKSIMMRKQGVRNAMVGYMSSLISDGVMNSMTFNREMTTYEKKMKSKRINFIIAGTPTHIKELVMYKEYDFLNRFVFLEVSRKDEEFMEEAFRLEIPMHHKFDKVVYKAYKNEKFKVAPRFNETINVMLRGFNSIGIDGKEFIRATRPLVFDPTEYTGPIDLAQILKPIKV